MMKLESVRVINIMADGSICNDLSHYLDNHELPENVMRLIADFIREGAKQREKQVETVECPSSDACDSIWDGR